MSRRAVAACVLSKSQGWLERASGFRCLPRGDGSPAPVRTHPRGKDLLQPRGMDEIPPSGSDWVRSRGGQQQVSVRQSLRFSTHPLLVNLLATEKYMGLQVLCSVWKMLGKEDRLLQYQADKQHSHLYITEIIDTDLCLG